MNRGELERNTYNFRFKRAKKEQNWLKEAFLATVGISLLMGAYLVANGLLWLVETFV